VVLLFAKVSCLSFNRINVLTSHSIVEATAAANRIISVRSTATKKVLRPLPPGKGPAAVEFQNVHFTYKDRDVPVLAGVNIKVCHPGLS
jgi:ABC-type multidrug transport system fused ATPase/permease subunit